MISMKLSSIYHNLSLSFFAYSILFHNFALFQALLSLFAWSRIAAFAPQEAAAVSPAHVAISAVSPFRQQWSNIMKATHPATTVRIQRTENLPSRLSQYMINMGLCQN